MIFGMNGSSLDLNAVRMLVQVAEARSFTVAAGQLGLSQSGLSRAIGRLEATLGVKLLQRNTRNVALTPDGRQFVDQVAPLLKISAPSMFGRKVLVPLLGPLLQQHPQLQVDAVLSDRLVDLVEEGFDAALRTGVIADQRIVARPLRPLRWVTVASPAYLARCGTPGISPRCTTMPAWRYATCAADAWWTGSSGRTASCTTSPRRRGWCSIAATHWWKRPSPASASCR